MKTTYFEGDLRHTTVDAKLICERREVPADNRVFLGVAEGIVG